MSKHTLCQLEGRCVSKPTLLALLVVAVFVAAVLAQSTSGILD